MRLPKLILLLLAVITVFPVAIAIAAVSILGWLTVAALFVILIFCDAIFISFFIRFFSPIEPKAPLSITAEIEKVSEDVKTTDVNSTSNSESSSGNTIHQSMQKLNQLTENNENDSANLKQEMQEIASAKARDDAMLDSIGDGVIVTDNTGKILKINATACYYLELNSAKVTGKVVSDAYQVHDEQGNIIPQEKRPIFLALKNNTRVTQTVIFISEKKPKRILRVVATPVIEQGTKIGGIQTFRDITQEHEVDRMKTEFISLASHQLRTPLSEIKWLAGLLMSEVAGKLEPEQLKLSTNILNSTERMIDLVNSLLNISRMESGRILIDPHPTDLRILIREVEDDIRVKTEERQQKLIIDFAKDVPYITIDLRLIRQVYLNLLTNSIKYSPPGGEIRLTVTQDGKNIISAVQDSGCGIPEKEQHKVFNKFFRAENAIKIQTDGSGLGLYLIKSIVEASGGKIWFKSSEGQGTTFWFSLPLSGSVAKKGEVTLDS